MEAATATGPKVITAGGGGLTSAILRKKQAKKKKAAGGSADKSAAVTPTGESSAAGTGAASSAVGSAYGTPESHPAEGAPADDVGMDLISLGEPAAAVASSSAAAPPPPYSAVEGSGVVTAGGAGSGSESDRSARRAQNRSDDDEISKGGFIGKKGGRKKGDGRYYDHVDGEDEEDEGQYRDDPREGTKKKSVSPDDLYASAPPVPSKIDSSSAAAGQKSRSSDLFWLFFCFLGIMVSFVCYGLLLEYATSGGRKLHELSFLFVTSSLYTCTAAAGRYVRDETPSTIPPARFAVLGLTSMGSTFFSVRSLRYVIYPIQVLAKSCKPVPVMIMGALMGKKYPFRKYVNVCLIVSGVALFMGGGDSGSKKGGDDDEKSGSTQVIGIFLLFISLCFDGGTGAYEDKLMSVHSVGPFDLMYNIQLGKTILAGVGLLVLNQVHLFIQMCQDMGFVLVALGLTGAIGQVFIFVTIAKFGALTCSIIGLSRKVTTLVASIYFYGHELNAVQGTGLIIAVGSMVMNFWGKKGKGGGHGHGGGGHGGGSKELESPSKEEMRSILAAEGRQDSALSGASGGGGEAMDIELGPIIKNGKSTSNSAHV